MKIQLIEGEFTSNDSLDLITQMIHIKIKYHERLIKSDSVEEDIKNRERKIKRLQKELFELRHHILSKTGNCKIDATINIDCN